MDNYPQSPFRPDAKLGLGDTYLGEGNVESLVLAVNEFKEFLSFYPTHRRADYAQYKLALCHYRQMRGPERDQRETREAVQEFETFIAKYPNSPLRPEVQARYREARDRLSLSEYRVGYFYFRQRWYPGAIARFRALLKEDPSFTQRDALYYYLGEALLKVKLNAEALPLFDRLVKEFDTSEYPRAGQAAARRVQGNGARCRGDRRCGSHAGDASAGRHRPCAGPNRASTGQHDTDADTDDGTDDGTNPWGAKRQRPGAACSAAQRALSLAARLWTAGTEPRSRAERDAGLEPCRTGAAPARATMPRHVCAARHRPAPGRRARRAMNLPNALSVTRIFLVPLLVVVLLTKFEGHRIFGVQKELVGAAIFGLASLTDWLDGYLARRRGQITALGQMIDPIADKLLTSAAFISLVQLNLAPAWMVAVIIGRELAVTGLRSFASTRGRAFPASSLGKVKMVAQVVAILLLILGQNGTQPFFTLGKVALWVVVATAIISAVDYYRAYAATVTEPLDLPRDRSRP